MEGGLRRYDVTAECKQRVTTMRDSESALVSCVLRESLVDP